MDRFMFWLAISTAIFLTIVIIIVVIGLLLPQEHEAEGEREIAAPIEEAFAVIRNPEEYPRWRSGVRSVIKESDTVWLEKDSHGHHIRYCFESENRPSSLLVRILSEGLPYQGTWEYHFLKLGPYLTRVRIREEGKIYNPIFRFLSRFFFGHTATIHQILKELSVALENK
ncbi:polyketide cyclase/dehydrase and lipid transport [Leptospira fainei serovar Hurstbridge str. BUT 6]|uniref:Polyketide cyclase/dehydrase and lipid transport n=1 Tax=Leptospira fainei serovar Hurstbridge str. BUT 6 TaxID=1193011 RepID=S3V0C4_9LEPT|nr:SRPBCC family protein [Leptospira fainei]EPG74024.1 polyketide cyclase/dehydrase and lipid transport [Leptospira fainei serovar Hurstbridge str. BUT 6]